MGSAGGSGTSGGAYLGLICLARWSVCAPDRATGGAALSAGHIDAVAHLGVRFPGWVGESGGPSGGRCSGLP